MQLSPAAQRFLLEFVHTYDELEVILLLFAQRPQPATCRELATRLNLSSEVVRTACSDLVGRGVLSQSQEPSRDVSYPQPSGFDSEVDELGRSYAESRVPIVQAMSQNALARVKKSALHTFAEAFRLRRPKDG